jgi:hypothetical protein
MQPIELPRHLTALDKTSRPGGRLAQTGRQDREIVAVLYLQIVASEGPSKVGEGCWGRSNRMPSPGPDRAPVTPAAAHAHGSVVALKHIGILNISRIPHDFEAGHPHNSPGRPPKQVR